MPASIAPLYCGYEGGEKSSWIPHDSSSSRNAREMKAEPLSHLSTSGAGFQRKSARVTERAVAGVSSKHGSAISCWPLARSRTQTSRGYSPSIFREIGDRRGEGNSLGNLGNAYAALGETRRAIEHYQQSLAIGREISDPRIIDACEKGLRQCRGGGAG